MHTGFLRGSIKVVVATVAFGMGINKRNVRNVINGSHPGCLEGRDWLPYLRDHQGGGSSRACEFDGRLSLLHFKKRFWLFARQNPATHSQRFVQVTVFRVRVRIGVRVRLRVRARARARVS